MYDIKPLEEEWKQYQRKKKNPLYMFIFVVSLVSILFLFLNKQNMDLTFFDNYFNNKKVDLNNLHNSISLDSKNALLNLGLKRLETVTEVRDDTMQNIDKSNEMLVDIPILDIQNQVENTTIYSERKKMYLNIIETSSATAYEDVEKRFLQSHDIDDALFLAKSYYKKGNYKKAKHWAYEVNKLNQDLEESLLIFIQSKVKLGERNDALSLLKNYLTKSNSDEAKNLLYKIENNTL